MFASLAIRSPIGRRETTSVAWSLSLYWPGLFAKRGFFAASGSDGRTRNVVGPDVKSPANETVPGGYEICTSPHGALASAGGKGEPVWNEC
jgi:hypothetical protein